MRKRSWALGFIALLWIQSSFSAQPSPVIGRVTAADPKTKTFAVETQLGGVTFAADDRLLSSVKVGEQVRVVSSSSRRGPIAARVERMGAPKTVTCSVAAVDLSERQMTIEMPHGSAALETINAGDPVKIQISPGILRPHRIDDGPLGASGSLVRRSLGLWLLAITATLVGLRARRMRLV